VYCNDCGVIGRWFL